jgi:DNA-binding GntR family transcriptional regulator
MLMDEILSGTLAPGAALDETELALRFNVSRTPVREALRQLSASGLVMHRAHRGAVVADVSENDLRHMFEVLTELEVLCVSFAVERMTAEERRQLEALHHASEAVVRGGDDAEYARYNDFFHAMIHQGTHNPFLIELIRSAKTRVAPFRRIQFRAPGRLAASYAEHQAILDRIQRGDVAGASGYMRAHLARSLGVVNDVRNERDQQAT